jgi:EAL domain-containing protein (putative c-di-GMP-specific phosphodiesterase class I)
LSAVKLDRELVQGLAKGAQPEAGLATALAGAARACGLAVYAEGVEAEAQRHRWPRWASPAGKGFLCSRPLDAAVCWPGWRTRKKTDTVTALHQR